MAAVAVFFVIGLVVATPLHAQSAATLQGRVYDASGAVLRGATISVRDDSTGFDRSVPTDDDGHYQMSAIPVGSYEITVSANGFKSAAIEALTFEVGRTLVRDFHLDIGDARETVSVTSAPQLIDRATANGVVHRSTLFRVSRRSPCVTQQGRQPT